MGYGGKWREREQARELRAQAWTLQEIADELGVAKGTVSVWVRDVEFTPKPRNRGHPAGSKHPMRVRKEVEIEQCRDDAMVWAHSVTQRERSMFALGLYAGEGSKTGNTLGMANTNPRLLWEFVEWIRRDFMIDESRLRVVVYLHEGLDLDAAEAFWSRVLSIPRSQFTKPYRAIADSTIRSAKHRYGCATVRYASAVTIRRVLARIEAVTSVVADPG